MTTGELRARLLKLRDALCVVTPMEGTGGRVTIHPTRAAEYATSVDIAIAALAAPLPNPEADQLREALKPLADLEIPEGKSRVAGQTEAYFPIRFSEIENARAALTKETTNVK